MQDVRRINEYAYTSSRDEEHPMSNVIYDKKEQLDKINAAPLSGETVEVVFEMKGGG